MRSTALESGKLALLTELEILRKRKENVKIPQMLFKLRKLWQVKITKLIQKFCLIHELYGDPFLTDSPLKLGYPVSDVVLSRSELRQKPMHGTMCARTILAT